MQCDFSSDCLQSSWTDRDHLTQFQFENYFFLALKCFFRKSHFALMMISLSHQENFFFLFNSEHFWPALWRREITFDIIFVVTIFSFFLASFTVMTILKTSILFSFMQLNNFMVCYSTQKNLITRWCTGQNTCSCCKNIYKRTSNEHVRLQRAFAMNWNSEEKRMRSTWVVCCDTFENKTSQQFQLRKNCCITYFLPMLNIDWHD